MKKSKWIVSLFAFVIVSVLCVQFAGKNAEEKYVSVSKDFSLPVGNYILLMKDNDMDGDGKADKIYVYGEKSNEETEYASRINIALVYAKNGFVKKTNISWLEGYVSDVEIMDFTKNKNKDVLLKVYSDENKSVITGLVADFGYDIPKCIFSGTSGISVSASLSDGFVANCTLPEGQHFAVNLSAKKDMLVKEGVFDGEGICQKGKKVYAKPFYELDGEDGKLKGKQKVVLSGTETELFIVESVQKYEKNKWVLEKIEVKY